MNLSVSNFSVAPSFARKNKKAEKENKKKLLPELNLTDKQKKVIKGVAALAIAGTAAAVIIGKNPSHAKVKTGTLNTKNKLYLSAQEELNSLLNMKGSEYKYNLEDFAPLFKKQGKYDFEEAADSLVDFVSKEGSSAPEEIQRAAGKIKETVASLIKKREDSFETFKGVTSFDVEKAAEDVKSDIEILKAFSSKEGSPVAKALKTLEDAFNPEKAGELELKLNAFEVCPAGILPEDGIYYHGTKSARKIFKHGLSPFESAQVKQRNIQREGGAACYLSPDKKVSATFAAPIGQVLPYKMDENATTAIGSQGSYERLRELINEFIEERKPVEDSLYDFKVKDMYKIGKNIQQKTAMSELLTRKIILDNGFDNVFLAKGISYSNKNAMGNINLLLGRSQSQIIAYSPEKLQLMPRDLKDRILDIKEAETNYVSVTKNAVKGIVDFINVLRVKKNPFDVI